MPNPMTIKGAEDLRAELAHRKGALRQEISEAIAEARAHGDLKENAEYHAAREQQSFNEGRIQEIESRLADAQIIDVRSNFNVEDFKYAECSTCTNKIGLDTYKKTDGFFTEYSRSTASEDMAEVFSHLIVGSSLNNSDKILEKKIQFIKTNLLKIDKNFIL